MSLLTLLTTLSVGSLLLVGHAQSQAIVDNFLAFNEFTLPSQDEVGLFEPVVLVHGGAGDIPDSRDMGKHRGTRMAAKLGYIKLANGGSAVDAVEAAVRSMELDDNFNAGYGSVLNLDGDVSMDASIQDGDLRGGCVTLINDILHPISLARTVMEKSGHTFLGGEGAMRFAKSNNIKILYPPGKLVTQASKDALTAYKRDNVAGQETGHQTVTREANSSPPIPRRTPEQVVKDYGEVGTVGAVAMDQYGNVAAATSTGGMTGKLPGRIGDSPILGSGTSADNNAGAVSTTGHGETIMKFNVASKILQQIELLNLDAQTATERVLNEMTGRLFQTAGAITIDRTGEVGIHWTSEKMAWAYQRGNTIHYGIKHGDHFTEPARKLNINSANVN